MRSNTNVTSWAQKNGLESDLISPGQHSRLLDAHPHGGVNVPVEELFRPAVCESDDTASDSLQRRIGGVGVADNYIHHLGIGGIRIAGTERTDVSAQYRNYAEPAAMVAILRDWPTVRR